MEVLAPYYLVIKSLHIIAIICWMAALLYLPRLFLYHTTAPVGSAQSETFKTMEMRLARVIMTPAMIASFIFGGLLALVPGTVAHPNIWFHVKVMLVLGLAGIHGYYVKVMKDFAVDKNQRSPLFFRVLNESTTILMIIVIFLVVMKPF